MALVDLTQQIYAGMPRIHVLPEVETHPVKRIANGDPLNISETRLATHAGTHVDAPWHFDPDGLTIERVPLERLCGPAVVVPVERQAGTEITVGDLERSPEPIRAGDIVLLATGWGAKFDSPDYNAHPYVAEEAARWLVERGVGMLGVDMISVDMPTSMRPPGFTFPAHHALLDHGVLIIENLTNLHLVAGKRVTLYAFALPLRGADGAQARVVAEL